MVFEVLQFSFSLKTILNNKLGQIAKSLAVGENGLAYPTFPRVLRLA